MTEEKKHIVFIVNPISGTRNKKAVLDRIIGQAVNPKQYSIEVIPTRRAGHATEIAALEAQNGAHIIVAVGGDGTINEVAQSLVHTPTTLGIIPCGSGNGLARHLQIPLDPRKAIELINEGCINTIDYGKINGTPFFCTCGLGFDAFVSLKFASAGKRGMLTYLEKILQEYLAYEPEMYELTVEDRKLTYKAFLIACGNASQYGNNAYITPRAAVTDGLLDVTILEPFTMLDIPELAFQLFNKTIDQNSRIKTFKCKSLRIHRDKPGVAHFDGDPMTTETNIDIEIICGGLQVMVPQVKTPDTPLNMMQMASHYLTGLRAVNTMIKDNIAARNKLIINRNRRLIRKMIK